MTIAVIPGDLLGKLMSMNGLKSSRLRLDWFLIFAPMLGNAPVEKVMPTKFGPIVDTATRTNLTEKRLGDFSKFVFKDLPFKDAVKTVKGDGSRGIATFEDPNCGFCKKLMQEIDKIDKVTVYTFLIPVLGLTQQQNRRRSGARKTRANPELDS